MDFSAVDPRLLTSLEVVSRDLSAHQARVVAAFLQTCSALSSLVLWIGRGDLREGDLGPLLDDVDLLTFALSRPSSPELPIALVRALLTHHARPVREKAVRHLVERAQPEDAGPVLEAIVELGAQQPGVVATWLGSHPESERLLPLVNLASAYEIVRRRRCAGLTTDPSPLEARLLKALSSPIAPEIRDAVRIVEDLHLVGFAPALAGALGPEPRAPAHTQMDAFASIAGALESFGKAGTAAIRYARGRMRKKEDAARKERLTTMLDLLERPSPRHYTQERADELFDAGTSYSASFEGAFDHHARILFADPRNAHAAERCASIERSHGVWMSPARLEWLRSLGARATITE